MVRPFEGYITEDGKTFDTIREAEAYEAALSLHAAVRAHELVEKLDLPSQNYIVTEVVRFIGMNKATVARYIETGANARTIQLQGDMFDYGKEQLERLSGAHTGTGGSVSAPPEDGAGEQS